MTNEMKRKMAYTRLSNRYNKIYFKIVLYRVLSGLLEGAAIAVTYFALAAKINSNVIDGGPSAFFKIFGLVLSAAIFIGNVISIPEIRTSLEKQYRKAKLLIMMKYS